MSKGAEATSIFTYLSLLVYLGAVTTYLYYYRYELNLPKHRDRVEMLYPNIEVRTMMNDHGYLFYPMFIFRRIFFISVPSILPWKGGLQLQILCLSNSFYMMMFAGIQPYGMKILNRIQIFNECIFMVLSYHMMVFSDYVMDSEAQFTMGYSFLTIIGILSVANLGVIAYNVTRRACLKTHGKVSISKQQKQLVAAKVKIE